MRDVLPRILLGIIIVVFVGPMLYFIVWLMTYQRAGDIPKEIMESGGTKTVAVRESKDIIFLEPQTPSFHKTGIIFYPGGRIEPTAYVPLLLKIAEEKYPCVITKMPFRLAIFEKDKAAKAMNGFDESMQWVLAGHSVGGAAASEFAAENPDLVEGLILIGAYPGKEVDLSDENLPVLLIAGGKDGLADLEDVEERRSQLPEDHLYELIPGANHGQFGHYKEQKGDNKAAISRKKQQQITADLVLSFMQQR